MKGLKRIALVAAIAAASSAQAEMVSMDDAALSTTTGQAGLTVDFNALDVSIAAIDYKDQGFLSIKDVVLGGGTGFGGPGDGILNNFRMTIDIAGDGSDLGESRLGEEYISTAASLVGGQVSGNYVAQTIDDGDLVISIRAIDSTNLLQSVDYGLHIGSIGLGASTETEGSVTNGTTLVSDLNLTGYVGPIDIIIDGNDGGMNISAYFNATGNLNLDFMAVSTNLTVHNSRGTDQIWLGSATKGTSMAHAQVNISKVDNYQSAGQTALALDIQNFEADIDLTSLTLGTFAGADGRGIGDIFVTDLKLSAQTVVFGH